MKPVQILMPDASSFQQRSQRLDRSALEPLMPIETIEIGRPGRSRARRLIREALARTGATVAHVYASSPLPGGVMSLIEVPVVASVAGARPLLPWKRPREPRIRLGSSPDNTLPPVVEEGWFTSGNIAIGDGGTRIGVLLRDGEARDLVEGARQRISRFRDDVRWVTFNQVPTPEEMRQISVWFAPSSDDPDNGVPEAMAAARAIVAVRSEASRRLLAEGAAGFLVPASDANEVTHAILAALFKPELNAPRRQRAREAAEEFRAARRAERLIEIYHRAMR